MAFIIIIIRIEITKTGQSEAISHCQSEDGMWLYHNFYHVPQFMDI